MKETEDLIVKRFDEIGSTAVEASIDDDNFELRQIIDLIGQPKVGDTLLDVGSGKGKFSVRMKELGFRVTGVEPSAALLSTAHDLYPDINFVQASATALPFPDNNFDCLICVEVLEHVPDTDQAIREMARVIKPGGRLIIIDKNITSLHYLYFFPTIIWKWWKEITGQWMYPADFPFREKYFSPLGLTELLRQYFSDVTWQGIKFTPLKRPRPRWLSWLWGLHSIISSTLHHLFPARDFYISWRAQK